MKSPKSCGPRKRPRLCGSCARPRAGQSFARLRGLAEARYEFLSFIDDDNWVCEDWVQIAYSQMLAHPDVGLLGAPAARPLK